MNTAALIRGMMPWLKIKKVLAQDYLRYYALYPSRKHRFDLTRFFSDEVRADIRFCPGIGSEENFWGYLAGFFDAEGCVTRKPLKNGTYQVGRIDMAQVGSAGQALFLYLKSQLELRGIRSIIAFTRRYKANHQDIYNLRITNYAGCEDFMRGVLPYLHMKKVIVQDHLRYFVLFPKAPWRSNGNYVPDWDLVADRKSGMTLQRIADKRGIAMENVSRRLIKIRRRQEARLAA